MFIFGLPALINHKERTKEIGLSEIHRARKGPGRLHETLDKYTYFQKIVLLFQKITINKIVLYILENYNQQNHSLHLRKLQPAITTQGKNHKKEKREVEKREKMGGEV